MTTQQVIGILIPLTAISSYINYRFTKLPKSIGITLITLTLSLLVAVCGRLGWKVDDFAQNLLDGIGFNETFLHGMLSFLLFAGSLHVNAIELAKYKSLVALLATVSVVISTLLVGYAMYGLTKLLGIALPFYYCFVFCSGYFCNADYSGNICRFYRQFSCEIEDFFVWCGCTADCCRLVDGKSF